MEASYRQSGTVVIVELRGRLNVEMAEPFRRTCLEKLIGQPVVFDLKNLNFVGSLGLKGFVDTLELMARSSHSGVRFSGVGSEFRRLFEASGILGHFYDNPERAAQSFFSSIN